MTVTNTTSAGRQPPGVRDRLVIGRAGGEQPGKSSRGCPKRERRFPVSCGFGRQCKGRDRQQSRPEVGARERDSAQQDRRHGDSDGCEVEVAHGGAAQCQGDDDEDEAERRHQRLQELGVPQRLSRRWWARRTRVRPAADTRCRSPRTGSCRRACVRRSARKPRCHRRSSGRRTARSAPPRRRRGRGGRRGPLPRRVERIDLHPVLYIAITTLRSCRRGRDEASSPGCSR